MSNIPSNALAAAEARDRPSRRAFVLHGGGGPQTVAPIVGHLAATMHAVAPTHPGWNGTALPDTITSVTSLASVYLDRLLDEGDHDVMVVGSSLGGWIALEMAVQAAADERYAGLIGAVVVIDGVGAVVEGEPIADFFTLDARSLAEVAWHDPERGYRDPAGFTDEQRAIQEGNRRAMAVIAGTGMSDAALLTRLSAITVPSLMVWGESDRVVTPAYGRVLAKAVPGALFVEIPRAGHLPQLESPEATWAAIDAFLERL